MDFTARVTLSTKFTKEELKSPDQVQKTLRQGFVWTTGHSKIIIAAIAVFIVVGLAVGIGGHISESKEQAQQEKYFGVEKQYAKIKAGFEEVARAEAAAAQAKDKKAAPPVDLSKKASGDITKDYGTVLQGFEALIAEAPKSKAAQMAALHVSEIYVNYKQDDKALETLNKIEAGVNKKDVLASLVWMQMGNILANKGDCKTAVTKYQSIADTKTLAFARDEAKLRMGLCYESMNDTAKAEQLYTEVSKNEDPATTDFAASREAQKYLRLLKAKSNL